MARISDLDLLLASENLNGSVIQIDNFIGELCNYGEDFGALSEPQKLFYLNQCLEREVNNGGFNQYFLNSSGDYAHETIVSLQAIGAIKTASILKNAIDQFPDKKVPKEREKRTEIIESIEQTANGAWEELDEKFFEYEDDLNSLNIDYIKKHKASF